MLVYKTKNKILKVPQYDKGLFLSIVVKESINTGFVLLAQFKREETGIHCFISGQN